MSDRRRDNSFSRAGNIALGRTTRGLLGRGDRVDFYKFSASSRINFSLAVSGFRTNVNVQLFNSNRVLIARSQQPGNRPEGISATLQAGTFFIQVQLAGRGDTRYRMSTGAVPAPSPTPNPNPVPTPTPTPTPVGDGTLATAVDLGVLSTTITRQDVVGANDSSDFYKFTLNDVANLQIRATGSSTGIRFALIRDSNTNGLVDNNEVLASDSSFSANSLADTTQDLPPGIYFIRVESTSTRSTQYQLNLIPTLFGGNVSPEPGNTLPVASDLGVFSGTRSFREYVGTIDTTDIYRFTLNDLSNLQITANASSTPVRVQLVRDANNNDLIDSNEVFVSREGSGVTTPARINEDLPVGTYFIRVDPRFGTSPTSYEMTVVGTLYEGNGLPDPGNTLSTARNFGTLSGTTSSKEYIGVLDSIDIYRFTLSNIANLQARVTSSSDIDVDLALIQDTNNNGLIDNGETIRTGIDSLTRDLQVGTYFLAVDPRFSSQSTNYQLDLTIT